MSVRRRLAVSVFATGLLTAVLVVVAVLFAFQRLEREIAWHRGNDFLQRAAQQHDDLFELHARDPQAFEAWMRSLLLFEPDTQLYLLDGEGRVLAASSDMDLAADFRVALSPVRQALDARAAPYVMGDDPERMDRDAVIAALALHRVQIRPRAALPDGYLYLVCHPRDLPAGGWAAIRTSVALPALAVIVGLVLLASGLAAAAIVAVTRPLRALTQAVAQLSREGPGRQGLEDSPPPPLLAADGPALPRDEFGQLTGAFRELLATLREQWAALRRLDHFRREAVSNLSHDLRSPMTATAACLETLEARWADDPARAEDRELLAVAQRNAGNAARLVQSLGELARLDEPAFALRAQRVDLRELLDDIQLRFAERAARQQVALSLAPGDAPAVAQVDVELFERAIANLLDNALKFCRPGDRIGLGVTPHDSRVQVDVTDSGPGIPAEEVPLLFDRYYRGRQTHAPATGDGGKGLGLAIVRRIAELHGGGASLSSRLGHGTAVHLWLPADSA